MEWNDRLRSRGTSRVERDRDRLARKLVLRRPRVKGRCARDCPRPASVPQYRAMRLRTLAATAILTLAAVIAPLLPGPLTALGQAPRPPIKVGLFLPYTGVIAVNGQETTKGVELFLAKIGYKAGGREIQLLKEDD